jgi:peroxiredoxin
MKNKINNLLILYLAVMLVSCTNKPGGKNQFTINGTIEGDYSGYVFLIKRVSGEWQMADSIKVENSMFIFKGNITLPEMYHISIEGDKNYAAIFLEPSEISFKADAGDIGNAQITGSSVQKEFDDFNLQSEKFDVRYEFAWEKIQLAMESGNTDSVGYWEAEFDKVDRDYKQFVLETIKLKNSSVVSAYILVRNADIFDETEIEPVLDNFDPSMKESVYVKNMRERVEILKRVAVGQPAVDFTMTDTAGNPVTLSSFYGKYLLVDFWASWCGPCRRENPNVVDAYNKFNNKGFDIVGVSFDKNHSQWVEAVISDKLTWHHVSDLKYWGNEAGKLYGINSIPSNILIDPKGVIIAKNLRGEELHTRLAEFMN